MEKKKSKSAYKISRSLEDYAIEMRDKYSIPVSKTIERAEEYAMRNKHKWEK